MDMNTNEFLLAIGLMIICIVFAVFVSKRLKTVNTYYPEHTQYDELDVSLLCHNLAKFNDRNIN